MRRHIRYGAALLCCAGCVTGMHQDTIRVQTFPAFEEHRRIRRAAVIPFMEYYVTRGEAKTLMGVPERITRDNGKVLCDIFTKELRDRVGFSVIGPEKVAERFGKRGERIAGILPRRDVLRVGADLKADALVMGQVDRCSTYKYRQHNNSRVALQVRMTDTATGEPIWQGSISLDDAGMPHEVAERGIRLLLDQVMSKLEGASSGKKSARRRIIDR